MIVFCEDCGERNEITDLDGSGPRTIFVCSCCQYANNYASRDVACTADAPLAVSCLEIAPFKGMMGYFFYHSQKGVVASAMPDVLSDQDMRALGAHLVGNFQRGQSFGGDLDSMTVLIADKFLIVHPMDDGLYAVVAAASRQLPEPVRHQLNTLQKRTVLNAPC